MSAEQFEDRLLAELKHHVTERSRSSEAVAVAVAEQQGRRERTRHASPWRLAGSSITVAAAIAAAAVLANGGPPTAPPAAQSPSATATGPLFHAHNAAFAIDAEPSGAVDITILQGNQKPDVAALRTALAKAGVQAQVVPNVPTCQQLASRPGAPSPVGSAQANAVADIMDRPLSDANGDLVFSVDTSAHARGTTLWIMFSSTLSTIFVERTASSGPQPNCL
jgi:hypothetical protein